MEIIIRKGGRLLLRKLIGKGSSKKERNEIVKLENKIVMFEIVLRLYRHGATWLFILQSTRVNV